MEEPLYVLNPDGDLILILRNPDAPFAVWDEWDEWGSADSVKSTSVTDSDGLASAADSDEPEPEPLPPAEEDQPVPDADSDGLAPAADEGEPKPEPAPPAEEDGPAVVKNAEPERLSDVRFRLSSRHLGLASRYFQKRLEGPWKDGSPVLSGNCRYIYAEDWDIKALPVLVQIIHGRNRSVPRSVSLEMLAKIAVLVDYYECHEAVEIFSETWVKALESPPSTQYNRDLILKLVVSWVFGQADMFQAVTETALQQSRGPLPILGLPIRESLVRK